MTGSKGLFSKSKSASISEVFLIIVKRPEELALAASLRSREGVKILSPTDMTPVIIPANVDSSLKITLPSTTLVVIKSPAISS